MVLRKGEAHLVHSATGCSCSNASLSADADASRCRSKRKLRCAYLEHPFLGNLPNPVRICTQNKVLGNVDHPRFRSTRQAASPSQQVPDHVVQAIHSVIEPRGPSCIHPGYRSAGPFLAQGSETPWCMRALSASTLYEWPCIPRTGLTCILPPDIRLLMVSPGASGRRVFAVHPVVRRKLPNRRVVPACWVDRTPIELHGSAVKV